MMDMMDGDKLVLMLCGDMLVVIGDSAEDVDDGGWIKLWGRPW